jgi:hypothetical protein
MMYIHDENTEELLFCIRDHHSLAPDNLVHLGSVVYKVERVEFHCDSLIGPLEYSGYGNPPVPPFVYFPRVRVFVSVI